MLERELPKIVSLSKRSGIFRNIQYYNFVKFREHFIKICSKNGECDDKSPCLQYLRYKIIKYFDENVLDLLNG